MEGVLIAEFACTEAARQWYDRPTGKNTTKHRSVGASYRGLPSIGAQLPVMSMSTAAYNTIGSSMFGLIAGFLFWRYGLETTIMAHVLAHVFIHFVFSAGLRHRSLPAKVRQSPKAPVSQCELSTRLTIGYRARSKATGLYL